MVLQVRSFAQHFLNSNSARSVGDAGTATLLPDLAWSEAYKYRAAQASRIGSEDRLRGQAPKAPKTGTEDRTPHLGCGDGVALNGHAHPE